ncbi:MAG: permease prefix domain 1-containing protein [Ruminococcus sp.]|jgi:hypothetical protein
MEYQDKLREYIDQAFRELPATEEICNTKDELLADLLDHYERALAEEKAPEEAYRIALDSLGNVHELVVALSGQSPAAPPEPHHHEPGHPAPPLPPHHRPEHPAPPLPPHHRPEHPAPPLPPHHEPDHPEQS